MPPAPVHFSLYRIAQVTPAGECVQARLQPAGVNSGPPVNSRFCQRNAITVLQTIAPSAGGFVAVEDPRPDREPLCLGVTVALTIEVGPEGGDRVRVMALPRPAPVYIARDNERLLKAARQAHANGTGMVLAVGQGTNATDGTVIPSAEAERLLGFGSAPR